MEVEVGDQDDDSGSLICLYSRLRTRPPDVFCQQKETVDVDAIAECVLTDDDGDGYISRRSDRAEESRRRREWV
jgi:hypothetical protein